MPEQSRRLDEAMNRRRLDLGLSWREVAAAAGISYETLRAVRKGETRPEPLTKRGIERALQWEPGSVERVLGGGDPIPLGAGGLPREHSPPAQSSDEELSPEDLKARAIAAIMDSWKLTPDERERVLRNVEEYFLQHPQRPAPPVDPEGKRHAG